jgi:hypothetical protein
MELVQITRRHTPEDSTLHCYSYENLKFQNNENNCNALLWAHRQTVVIPRRCVYVAWTLRRGAEGYIVTLRLLNKGGGDKFVVHFWRNQVAGRKGNGRVRRPVIFTVTSVAVWRHPFVTHCTALNM